MMTSVGFKVGESVEYATHDVSWQDDGTPLPVVVAKTDGRPTLDDIEQPQTWAAAKVLAIKQHPDMLIAQAFEERGRPRTNHKNVAMAKGDVVATLAPEDGQPPFDLNVKLIRKLK